MYSSSVYSSLVSSVFYSFLPSIHSPLNGVALNRPELIPAVYCSVALDSL